MNAKSLQILITDVKSAILRMFAYSITFGALAGYIVANAPGAAKLLAIAPICWVAWFALQAQHYTFELYGHQIALYNAQEREATINDMNNRR